MTSGSALPFFVQWHDLSLSAHTNGLCSAHHESVVEGLSRITHTLVPSTYVFLSAWALDACLMLGVTARLFYGVSHIPVLAIGDSSGSGVPMTCAFLLPSSTELPG